MGTIRLLLALTVAVSHSSLRQILIHNGVAVLFFYIISGFYMAMIIDTKYSILPSWRKRFLLNRCLRLFPTYWAMLILLIVIDLINGQELILSRFNESERLISFYPMRLCYFIFSNFFFLGQDIARAKGIDIALIGTAWTVGIELMFYFVSSLFIISKMNWAKRLMLILSAFFLRMYFVDFVDLSSLGLTKYGVEYHFFPTLLIFFLLGNLSYTIFEYIKNSTAAYVLGWVSYIGILFTSIVFMFFLGFEHLIIGYSGYDTIYHWICYCIFAVLIPFIFMATRDSKIDSFIGQLSYPIYLCHVIVIWLFVDIDFPIDRGVVVFSVSCIIAVVAVFLIEKPIEQLRKRVSLP
jgi:peptidoglycan/LPS O-acetylase OafA/YrhL